MGFIDDAITNSLPQFDINIPDIKIEAPNKYKHASYQYELIMSYIKEFEDTLDDEHEVGVRLTSFGQSILMNVTDIGYANPYILVFYGFVNGQRSTLIQNMSQLNFLLTAVPKMQPDEPPKRIGFAIDSEE